ncbi:MAG TPA: helix-turn-helix transcriptional regulator [Terriglobales bacterium]|jgi:transcriptional regulator with XRE-family HTH domain|nr:helix-turn-helix transcriptional regulator [Terriglobales bacterium]
MYLGGQNLRVLREQLGLTMRDVESASARIAQKHGNDEFAIPPSRLSDLETKGVVPSVYRLYSLAVIYRRDIRELLSWFGVDLNLMASDLDVSLPTKSHFSKALDSISAIQMPVRIDPSFDPKRSANFGRMVEQWGLVPLSYLEQFATCQYTYGYVGTEDLTMYPILPPGSFVQVDETKNKVSDGGWRSEYERPIYFVETRSGHTCCWCTLTREELILQPHPLSPVAARVLKYPQQAEVIGQVVGAAMRLGEWRPVFGDPSTGPKERTALN